MKRNQSIKKNEDSVEQILNLYMQEIKSMAVDLAFSNSNSISSIKKTQANIKPVFNARKSARILKNKLKKQDLEILICDFLVKTEEKIFKPFKENLKTVSNAKNVEFIPSNSTFNLIVETYYEEVTDFKSNNLIKFNGKSENQENIDKKKTGLNKAAISDLENLEDFQKCLNLTEELPKKPALGFPNSCYKMPGLSVDSSSFVFLKLDLTQKNLRSLDFISADFSQIRHLVVSKNK